MAVSQRKDSLSIGVLVAVAYRQRPIHIQRGRFILKVFYAREPRGSSTMWSGGAVLKSASRSATVPLTARIYPPDGVRTRCLLPGGEFWRRRQRRCIRGHDATTVMGDVSTHDPARFRSVVVGGMVASVRKWLRGQGLGPAQSPKK